MGNEEPNERSNEPRFARRTPRPDWERFEPITHDEFDNALLTQAQRKFLLSGEEPSNDNRVVRSRIRSRFRRALLDLALLARHLSPEDYQQVVSEESQAPHGFDMEDIEDGLDAMVMFAAEACRTKSELRNRLQSNISIAQRRRGDESVSGTHLGKIEFNRRSDGWA